MWGVLGAVLIVFVVIAVFALLRQNNNESMVADNNNPTIDVVFTWSGPKHSGITQDERTRDNGELEHSVKAVRKNMPWVNKIFVLMNPPMWRPPWADANTIFLDHTVVFPREENALPTTSSNSIETTLHRIPGLAEHFIYFNDDFFVVRPMAKNAFFDSRGRAIVAKAASFENTGSGLNIDVPPTYNGFYPHIPLPVRKSAMIKFAREYAEYQRWIRLNKKRNGTGQDVCKNVKLPPNCLQLQGALAPFMVKENKGVFAKVDLRSSCDNPGYINSECANKLLQKDWGAPFVVVNDTGVDDEFRRKLGVFYNNIK